MLRASNQRGDTLVEVLLAIVVLSVITVGALSLMNRGVAESQNALERSSTRTLVNEQLELLHYFRDQYALASDAAAQAAYPASVWTAIKNKSAAPRTASNPNECVPLSGNSFFLKKTGATYAVTNYASMVTPATTPTAGQGLWIEGIASNGSSVPFIDLYVKACWNPVTGDVKQNMSTAVRLYDR